MQKTSIIILKAVSSLGLAVCLMSCKAVPSKEGTSLDNIKKELQAGIAANHLIAQRKEIPANVASALLPSTNRTTISQDGRQAPAKPLKRFNVTAEEVPARAFFLGLMDSTDQNIIVHPAVQGNISLKLNNVNINDTLSMIKRAYGFSFEATDAGIRILPATLQTRTFKVNYLDMIRKGKSQTKISSSGIDTDESDSDSNNDSDNDSGDSDSDSDSESVNSKINTTSQTDFWSELRLTLRSIIGTQEGRKVSISPMAGLIIVQAMPDELQKVEAYLKESEAALNRQVILETKIIEVELNDGYRAGINWGFISGRLQANQLGGAAHGDNTFPIPPSAVAVGANSATSSLDMNPGLSPRTTPIRSLTDAFGGVLTLGFNYKKLAAFVELLGTQGNVQVLSSPRVSTTNNQKALIKVGTDEFFVTNVSSSTTTTSGGTTTPSTDVEFDSFFSGIALDVTPKIDDDGYVTLHIHPTVSEVSEKTKTVNLGNNTSQEFPLAASTIRESDSVIRAKSGQLVVIGGLMQDRTSEVVTGVPFLKDMPFLGKAFRHTRQVSKKSELVILMRPMVMNDQKWTESIEDTYDRINSLDKGFHYGGNASLYGTMAEAIH